MCDFINTQKYIRKFMHGAAAQGTGPDSSMYRHLQAVIPNKMRVSILLLVLMVFAGTVPADIIDIQVAAGSDDAEERSDGSVGRGSVDLELVFNQGGNQTVGMRFNGVAIPPGSHINDAYIQFAAEARGSQTTVLLIEGEATDNPSTFINSAFNISSRPRTAASVGWVPAPWPMVGEAGLDQRTPNLAPVIQELVNRPGWSSGNSLVAIVTGSGERSAESFNGNQAAAPRLHIDFGSTSGNQPPLVNAGADASVALPNNSIMLDGTASDDGLPGGLLTTTWSHVGGNGSGTVIFNDINAVDTTATFTADPGSYVLRLTADDGALTSLDEVTITVGPAVISLDVQVAARSDDAEEFANGGMYRGSSDLELVTDNHTNQTVGLRFNGLNIPQGTSVTNAYIQFTVDEIGALPTALTIEGEATDNPPTFATSAFNISSRPRTVKSVAWVPVPWHVVGAAGPDQRTANLAPVIQELVNRPGWSSGNSLVIIITGNGKRVAESFNGKQAAAPRLHVEFVAVPGHQPPQVNAGVDAHVILPNNTLLLDGTASDDGQPGGLLTTNWSHVGGTGRGTVSFGDSGVVDTTASFTADPGTYVLRLSANDGEFSSFDDVSITVNVAGAVQAISQVGYFLTGFDASGNPLTVPAIDPAGIVYHEPSGRLFISDSEINEVAAAWALVQANLFETSPDGAMLFDQWNIKQRTGNEPLLNNEPTGITFCPGDAHFYVTNDNQKLVYRYAFDGTTFTAVDAVSTLPSSKDPEGISCDPATGRIYVIGGSAINILVYSYNSGFVLEEVLDLAATAGSPAGIPTDPEGIAFDPVSGNLFVVCSKGRCLSEYTTAGVFIKLYDINEFSPQPISPQGISVGTSSANPQTMSFYIADAYIDNNQNPNERDGAIYEAVIQRFP